MMVKCSKPWKILVNENLEIFQKENKYSRKMHREEKNQSFRVKKSPKRKLEKRKMKGQNMSNRREINHLFYVGVAI